MAKKSENDNGKENGTRRRRKRGWPLPWPAGYLLLWLVALSSLLLNVTILRQIITARLAAQQAVADAIAVLEGFQAQTFTYTVVVDETLPIDTAIQIDETFPVAINETLPVNTTVRANVDAGILGTIPLDIPISTSVPVDLDFEVPIEKSLPVKTAVPVYFEVPIEVSVAETPLQGTLDDVIARLETLTEKLDEPLLPFLSPQVEIGSNE